MRIPLNREQINIKRFFGLCFFSLYMNEIEIVEDIDDVADVILEIYKAKYNKPSFPNLGSL